MFTSDPENPWVIWCGNYLIHGRIDFPNFWGRILGIDIDHRAATNLTPEDFAAQIKGIGKFGPVNHAIQFVFWQLGHKPTPGFNTAICGTGIGIDAQQINTPQQKWDDRR